MNDSSRRDDTEYYLLDPRFTDSKRLREEREKARKLRKSQWWQRKIREGICHYCQKKFPSAQLTMDHVVPLARGGTSVPGNIVPACAECNRDKKLTTPAEEAFKQLEKERERKGDG